MSGKIAATILLIVSGLRLAWCRECCQTNLITYVWCSSYCCEYTSGSFYDYCCTSYSDRTSSTYSSSLCGSYSSTSTYTSTTVSWWVFIVASAGALFVVLGCIGFIVYYKKSNATTNRTGIVSQPGTAMTVVSSNAAPIQNPASHPGMFGGGPAFGGGTQQQQHVAYPPKVGAPSMEISKPSVSTTFG